MGYFRFLEGIVAKIHFHYDTNLSELSNFYLPEITRKP